MFSEDYAVTGDSELLVNTSPYLLSIPATQRRVTLKPPIMSGSPCGNRSLLEHLLVGGVLLVTITHTDH